LDVTAFKLHQERAEYSARQSVQTQQTHTHASIKNIKEYAPKDIFAVNFIFCFDSWWQWPFTWM